MDRAAPDSLDRETLIRLILSQAELIERLTQRVAELEATLNLPKKTPENSRTPPSKGQKPSGSAAGKDEADGAKKRGKSHPGAHRPLHPNPAKNREIPACAPASIAAPMSRSFHDQPPRTGLRISVLRATGERSYALQVFHAAGFSASAFSLYQVGIAILSEWGS